MPILITRGSGFIGAWVVRQAVDRGYSVVAAVRTEAQGTYLKDLYKDSLSYVVIPDITKEGAFDSAVVGVSGVIHVASPVAWTIEDPWKDVLNPAVYGTLVVLKSVHKFGKDIKRVVVTSSSLAATVMAREFTVQPPFKFRETDWNEDSTKVVEEKGKEASALDALQASKALAEKAAWKFVETEKLAFMCTFGPWLHSLPSPEKLGSTVGYLYGAIIASAAPDGGVSSRVGDWVDVQDVALDHVLANELEAAGGKRLYGSNGNCAWQEIFDVVGKKALLLPDGSQPVVKPGGKVDKVDVRYDSGPTRELFSEINWTTFERCFEDMVDQFADRGFLKRA